MALGSGLLAFVLSCHVLFAQDASRLYITAPAKAGDAKAGGAIGPLKNGEVYCAYEEGFRPKLFLENAADPCLWSVAPADMVEIINQYGPYGDTVSIYIKTPRNALSRLTITVKEGGYSKDLQIIIPRQAAVAGAILVEDLLQDTTYCADLEYQVRVPEDPNYTKDGQTNNYGGGLYPEADLRYRWSLSDGTTPIGSEILANPAQMYNWKYEVPTYARYWRVQPKTCENGNIVTQSTDRAIINVIPGNLTSGKLAIKAIRFQKEGIGELDQSGKPIPDWDTMDLPEYRNACVWYSSKFNSNISVTRTDNLGYRETENGYVYLQADPYKPEDLSFRHYQYEWIYDTADLVMDTLRMERIFTMSNYGFGPDKGRVCFRTKKRGAADSLIQVSYRMHCIPCNELAARQGKAKRYVSAVSAPITLRRIDTLVDAKIAYESEIRDKFGHPVQVTDDLPRLCGLTEYNFCSSTTGNGGQTEYLWMMPSLEWQQANSSQGCFGARSPAILETDTKTGDTVRFRVRPANYCFANGGDTSRNAKYLYAFLRSVPRAPRIVDTVAPMFSYPGYTKKQLDELVGSGAVGGGDEEGGDDGILIWPATGLPYPLLLCNNTYFGPNVKPFGSEQCFLLHTPRNDIKPNDYGKHPEEQSGFVVEFPKASEQVADALGSAYTIEPYKGQAANDTNVLVFRIDLAKRKALVGEKYIAMSLQAANECGAGIPRYFAINIIDTIPVRGHVHDNEKEDLVYDTLSLCEGTKLNMANESSTDGTYIIRVDSSDRNTDRIEYRWRIPASWRFADPATGPNADPVTAVWLGQQDGSVQLALRNRCGTSSFRSGDYIDVNPYARVAVKVVDGLNSIDMALDPEDPSQDVQEAFAKNPFLLKPCRGSQIMYAGDTTERTDLYRWEFPADWKVVTEGSGYNGTATADENMPNWAYTSNAAINSVHHDMRVRVQVGADTGNIYVVGQTLDCDFQFDNFAPDFGIDPPHYGHRRDSMKAVVRPFTGKPVQDGVWPDSICVRKVVILSVMPDITQDSLTRAQTHFTWKYPSDFEPVSYVVADDEDATRKRRVLTFTVPERTGDHDTITVYSHRFDCDAYNEGDSMTVIIKLTDTIPFVARSYMNDARRPTERIDLTPCEGDTVVYRVLPDPKRYLDSVWFTWNGGNSFVDDRTGLIDNTGWRVLNPRGRYADTLKMVVGRDSLRLGVQAVSPCGMSGMFLTTFHPISLVRDKIHLVEGKDVLCMNERVAFEWDSVRYATRYEWFYPWGKKHDTVFLENKMFYRDFSRKTAFDTGYVYVRPGNACGTGPYSDSVRIEAVIRHLGVPSVKGSDPDLELVSVRDTAYDTVCLRTTRSYQAMYDDADYADNDSWVYRWFGISLDASDALTVEAGVENDSSLSRFSNRAGFETKQIGLAVRHRQCNSLGDTLTIRIRPADTVAMDAAGLADRLSDWNRSDRAIMTKPCGTDTAEWHFDSDFGNDPVSYHFVWWDTISPVRARSWNPATGSMAGTDYKWLNPKTETEPVEDIWYEGDDDVLKMRVANNQTLFVSVDLKNRCGISRLPSLAIRTVTSIADSVYGLRMLSSLVCNGDSLVFKVDSSVNIGGFIWNYPWGAKFDTVKVGTQTERVFNVNEYDTGYVQVTPYNGCGNARSSNRIHVTEVMAVPSRAVPVDFDPSYDYARDPVARDTLCMRTKEVLHVSSDSWEEGKFETSWRLVQGNVTGFTRGLDSCTLWQTDVNERSFVLEFASRAKGCRRYSDTLRIEILPMDTLTFVMVEDPDEDPGRFEVVLSEIVRNYGDGTYPIDFRPCGGSEHKYTIKDNLHWSLSPEQEPYFSWNAEGDAAQDVPAADGSLGATDWKYAGTSVPGMKLRHLPLHAGFKDALQLHVNLRNLCGTSFSPAITLTPKPAVGQKPVIDDRPVCMDALNVGFDCAEVENAREYRWEFPWPPYQAVSGIPHLDVPRITDVDGNVTVFGLNDCGNGPSDTLPVMVIHTPKAPVPAWRQGAYTRVADTVYDTMCMHTTATLKVRRDLSDAPGIKFNWVVSGGSGLDIIPALSPSDSLCTLVPDASVSLESSVLLAVYGTYGACNAAGDTLFVRIGFEDTLSSAIVGEILVDPSDLKDHPEPCPEEEIGLRVEHDAAPAYKWTLPAGWKFKEGTDSTAASVTVVAGTTRGSIGVSPVVNFGELGCGSFVANPVRSVVFVPRSVPATPAFADGFTTYPCAGSQVTYRLESTTANNIKAYHWEFPADWKVEKSDAAVVGGVGDDNVWTGPGNFCTVTVGKDSGQVRAWAMDSCGTRLVKGEEKKRAVYVIDTARIEVSGDRNACLDSTVYLDVRASNVYANPSFYRLDVTYSPGNMPGAFLGIAFEDNDSTRLRIRCSNRDTAWLTFTPVNRFGCADNVEPFVHYIVTDTIPEIPGVIEGKATVCPDNPYTYVFHVDPLKKAVFKDIDYHWTLPDGWHVQDIENDTILHAYFDSVVSSGRGDTIRCYPRSGCGTAYPTVFALSVQPQDEFNDSILVDRENPCLGTELRAWLRNAGAYDTDTIRFLWNTPAGKYADWTRLDTDSLPRTSYRVQYDTASYISVRYERDGGCGMSKSLIARVTVKDSAAKARFDGVEYPCYTRDFYELAVLPDPGHMDSVRWFFGTLDAKVHTRVGSSTRNDSLVVDNAGHRTDNFRVAVRTYNECGHRDTSFTIRPITSISDFRSPLVSPRVCVSDTGYAYIDMTRAQRNQGLYFEWSFVPDSTAFSLEEFVAGDSTAVLRYLAGATTDSLRIVMVAGNDCSRLGDSMLQPRITSVVPFDYQVSASYDTSAHIVYGTDNVRISVDSITEGTFAGHSYAWNPEYRLRALQDSNHAERRHTGILLRSPEVFSVVVRQKGATGQEALPSYRREGLCRAYDTVSIVVDSLVGVVFGDEKQACVDMDRILTVVPFGGNYDGTRLDTAQGRGWYGFHVSWWYQVNDTLWQELADRRDSVSATVSHAVAGDYLYRVIVRDSTLLIDSLHVFGTSHADTAEFILGVYDALDLRFVNISSNPVEVPVGSRIQVQTRVYDGTGYYGYRWTSAPDSGLVLPGYDSVADTRTRSIYQSSRLMLLVTDTVSGCTVADTIYIALGKGSDIPNAFTPNGDGKNDIFLKGVSELTIYTRWGEQLFHTTQGEGWDGTYKGKKVRPGDYMYVAVVKENGKDLVFKGVVSVLTVD